MLNFEWEQPEMMQMQDAFNAIIPDSMFMTHYELHQACREFTPQQWKEFLLDPYVSDYVTAELRLLQTAELKKLMRDISKTDRAKSPGTAQILSTLSKTLDMAQPKEGPMFIYMAVPLNEEERKAPNVRLVSTK